MNREQRVERIKKAEEELRSANADLLSADKSCGHQFGETIPDHIYHKAYTIPGDAPGTMGVDFRGPCHVAARTEKRWKRVCSKCGKVEFTSIIMVKQVEQPKW